MLGGASVDWGPFISVEQAVLVETVPASKRNRAFARYALTGGLASAGGSLVAGLATNLARGSALFVCFAGLGLVTAALPLLLSKSVEGKPEIALATNRRPLLRLSGLFTLDAFSGGLVGNAVVAYWLHVRFHVGTELLGPAFTAMALLVAPSYLIAGWLGDRIGLIKTMVFTHLPAGLLLLLVPFAPNIEWAIAILLVRNSISQMDIPVRQAYVVSVVGPGERAGAVAITGAVRGFGQAFGPVIAGLAIQSMAFAFPFFLAASAQVIYDVGLYAGFRNRRGEHEVDWRSAREQNDASPPLP